MNHNRQYQDLDTLELITFKDACNRIKWMHKGKTIRIVKIEE